MPAVSDPLGYDLPLPLEARYYPMGCALDVATNSEDILRIAGFIWGKFPERPCTEAAILRVVVEDRDAAVPPVAAMPRGRGHLAAFIHGPDNFAICDLARSFTFVCLTREVARDAAYVRYHFLEPAGYLMVDARHLSPLHASCIALDGRALLLCGASGAGKTSLAYACARRGWTYLSDDATHIVRESPDNVVAGRPFRIRFRENAGRLFPELDAFTPERRPNGKLDIEADTSALGIAIALESRASHIVFLNREHGRVRAQTRPFPSDIAAARLSDLTCYGDEKIRREQDRARANLLRLPIVELTYSDLDDAESVLRSVVRGGT